MLGSQEEAEDTVQHTFAAAYRDLQRDGEREIALRPWLFTIARNRCLSVLRSRREEALDDREIATAGLAEQVERRAELRELLGDVRDLPDDQRAALLLAEVGGLSQTDIAAVLGCEVPRVKALVYRARSALVARREARELPCEEIREQLANLRGGSLRRTELRLHLRECTGCRDFREQVRRQRQLLSVALPVVPTLGLKGSVLGAVGIGGGTAAGLGAAGGAAGGGVAAGMAKLAAVGVLAAGGVAGGTAVVVHERDSTAPPKSDSAAETPAGAGTAAPAEPAERFGIGPQGEPPGQAKPNRGRGHAGEVRAQAKAKSNRGRGPVEAPPKDTPVRRGPPEAKVDKAAPPGRVKAEPDRPAPGAKAQPGPKRLQAPGASKPNAAKPGKGRAAPPQARPQRAARPDQGRAR
jgi:RNA polymerase sigma factor (sigma-70 family)